MHKDQLDQLLETICKEDWNQIEGLKDIEIPHMDEMLHTVQMKMKRESGQNRKIRRYLSRLLQRWTKTAVSATAILLCSFLLSIILDLPQVEAFKFNIIRTMFEVKDNMTVVHQTNVDYTAMSKGKTPPPPSFSEKTMEQEIEERNKRVEENDENKQEITRIITLEEAKKQFPVALLTLEYVPEGFELKEVQLKNHLNDIYTVEQQFQKNEDMFIHVVQRYYSFDGDFASSMVTSGDIKNIKVMGEDAMLIVYKNRSCTVLWRNNQNEYEIHGKVTEEEMMKIIDNLK